MGETLLNKDAQRIIEIENKTNINMYLSINRFAVKHTDKKGKIYYEPLLFHELRKRPISSRSFYNQNMMKDLLGRLDKQNREIVFTMPCQHETIYKPDNRIFVGVGTSPFGNIQLIRLHSIYGVPYIPASAMKGVFRNCWLHEICQKNENDVLKDDDFYKLFGHGEDEFANRGALIFMDTYPIEFSIGLDIVAPHYQAYYMKGYNPTDTESPNMLYYICLTKAKFNVYYGCTDKKLWEANKVNFNKVLNTVFAYYGVGSKTSIGYGIMSD